MRKARPTTRLGIVLTVVAGCASRPEPPAPAVASPPAVVAVAPADRSVPIAIDPGGDPNPPGTTLNRESVFVDPSPPEGWKQCAGFKNTSQDDVADGFLDRCLDTTRLRVRVFHRGEIEEDVFVQGIDPRPTWPLGDYLAGSKVQSVIVKATHWGTMESDPTSAFWTGRNGKDACLEQVAKSGMTFGSGHAERAIIAPGAFGYDEYRLSCGHAPLPDRAIALYR